MIIWIEKPLALGIHDRQLAEHGGSSGVRDESLLDSALARPQQLHKENPLPRSRGRVGVGALADLAASLAFGLSRNHPFVDGNKRTAAVACETFLMLNGSELQADDLALYPMYVALAEGTLPEAEFAAWLRQHIALDAGDAVHESRARYRR